MVTCLTQNLECHINKADIRDIYRVRGKNSEDKNNPIVVETSSSILKAEILKKGKSFNKKHRSKICSKHLGFNSQFSYQNT